MDGHSVPEIHTAQLADFPAVGADVGVPRGFDRVEVVGALQWVGVAGDNALIFGASQ